MSRNPTYHGTVMARPFVANTCFCDSTSPKNRMLDYSACPSSLGVSRFSLFYATLATPLLTHDTRNKLIHDNILKYPFTIDYRSSTSLRTHLSLNYRCGVKCRLIAALAAETIIEKEPGASGSAQHRGGGKRMRLFTPRPI